jgi:hypothetical protein
MRGWKLYVYWENKLCFSYFLATSVHFLASIDSRVWIFTTWPFLPNMPVTNAGFRIWFEQILGPTNFSYILEIILQISRLNFIKLKQYLTKYGFHLNFVQVQRKKLVNIYFRTHLNYQRCSPLFDTHLRLWLLLLLQHISIYYITIWSFVEISLNY